MFDIYHARVANKLTSNFLNVRSFSNILTTFKCHFKFKHGLAHVVIIYLLVFLLLPSQLFYIKNLTLNIKIEIAVFLISCLPISIKYGVYYLLDNGLLCIAHFFFV